MIYTHKKIRIIHEISRLLRHQQNGVIASNYSIRASLLTAVLAEVLPGFKGQQLPTVLCWGEAGFAFEEAAEEGVAREVQPVGDF